MCSKILINAGWLAKEILMYDGPLSFNPIKLADNNATGCKRCDEKYTAKFPFHF